MGVPSVGNIVGGTRGRGATVTGINPSYTNGDTAVVLVAFDCSTGDPPPSSLQSVSSITDDNGHVYTKQGQTQFTSTGGGQTQYFDVEIWTAPITKTYTATVTINLTGSAVNLAFNVWDVANLHTPSAPLDSNAGAVAHNSDVSGAASAENATISTSQADDLLIFWAVNQGQITPPAAPSGFTQVSQAVSQNAGLVTQEYFGFLSAYKVVSSAQSSVNIATPGTVANWGVLAIALTGDAQPVLATLSRALIIG